MNSIKIFYENYEVVFLTPDSKSWDPHDTSFAHDEASMLDAEGNLNLKAPPPRKDLVGANKVGSLYADPASVDQFDAWCDRVAVTSSVTMAPYLDNEDTALGDHLDNLPE